MSATIQTAHPETEQPGRPPPQMSSRLDGELLEVSMGPQHPSTHGVLQLMLEIEGENVVKIDPEITEFDPLCQGSTLLGRLSLGHSAPSLGYYVPQTPASGHLSSLIIVVRLRIPPCQQPHSASPGFAK